MVGSALLLAGCVFTATRLAVDYLPCPYSAGASAPQPRISDLAAPRLSWQFLAQGTNKSQSGYRIQVASSPARLQSGAADVWDSGLVPSSASLSVAYGGAPRPPRSQSFWRVQVWDEGGATCGPSDASAWGVWETPLLLEQDWGGAQWLTRDPPPAAPPSDCDLYQPDPAPLFRRDVALDAKPPGVALASARAYIAGLGYFELYINGAALPEAGALDPAFTSYNRTVLYSTQNATAAIGGAAAFTVGVVLGKGWWDPLPLRFWGHLNWRNALAIGPPLFRLALYLDFSDGSTQVVTSSAAPGSGWLVGPSELLRNNIYLGTVVNRSLEQPLAWQRPGFPAGATWAPPHAATAVPAGALRAAYMPPVRRFPAVPAVQLSSAASGPLGPGPTRVYDVGKQMSGTCRWCRGGGGAHRPRRCAAPALWRGAVREWQPQWADSRGGADQEAWRGGALRPRHCLAGGHVHCKGGCWGGVLPALLCVARVSLRGGDGQRRAVPGQPRVQPHAHRPGAHHLLCLLLPPAQLNLGNGVRGMGQSVHAPPVKPLEPQFLPLIHFSLSLSLSPLPPPPFPPLASTRQSAI